MKKLLLLFFMGICISTEAQVLNTIYPNLEGETLEGEKIILPNDTKGKYTLLGMAYSKKSEDDLNTWFQPVFGKFIQKSTGLFADFTYDVNVYFIPMFTGVNAAGAGTAKKKAVKKVDPNLHPYILFYKGDINKYKDTLDFERKDVPYFFVLDENGKIIYATSGAYSESKMDEIESVLE